MLHRAWSSLLAQWQIPHRSVGRKEVDLSKPDTIPPAFAGAPRLVINCAAWTDVDGAEKDEPAATAVNGTAVGHLARLCRQHGAMLVHYSTDYVFNGHGARPYRIDDPIEPINAYGRSKAAGETLLAKSGCDHLLIRTSWVYAPWGKNFVRTIARFLKQGQPLRIVNDQQGRPGSAEQLALNSARLIDAGASGPFHLADAGQCTWHAFASEIARLLKPGTPVAPCSSAELSRPAKRPAYSVLDIDPAQRILGPLLPWQDALADVVARLE
jgi:dTDP-4-dehydrorhamnose reductase